VLQIDDKWSRVGATLVWFIAAIVYVELVVRPIWRRRFGPIPEPSGGLATPTGRSLPEGDDTSKVTSSRLGGATTASGAS
jgi:hypothetical protein